MGIFDGMDLLVLVARQDLVLLHNLLDDWHAGLVELGFINHGDAQLILVAVGAGDFDEGVYLADGGNEVGDEGLEEGVDFDVIGVVVADVGKDVLDLLVDVQVEVLLRVVAVPFLGLVELAVHHVRVVRVV